jgi:ferredoxin--NADP+ reductase
MSTLGTDSCPARIAIIGSGPTGFFATDALLKSGQHVVVDVFERLASPFGLVRLGVAPDHGKIKTITKTFEKIMNDNPTRVSFMGNVTVGRDVTVDELRRHYDAVLFSSGAESDRRLGIPGEDLPGSHTATAFVAWYNGHPDARDLTFDLSRERAFVVGQGNVAMDVARILAKSPDELMKTDIATHALEVLAESKIKEIHVIGRRGPAQVKFTPPEVRELGELQACDVVIDQSALALDAASQTERETGPESIRKILEILEGFSTRAAREGVAKRLFLRFLESPTALAGAGRVETITLEKNRLSGEPMNLSATGTGTFVTEPCDILFRSVGYKGRPLPGVPFDEKRGVIPNAQGRVLDGGSVAPGLYTAGWIKRGPSGVIGTNKPDALETVTKLIEDLPTLKAAPERDSQTLRAALVDKGVRVISWSDWKQIDAAEIARGADKGKPREKITRLDEALALLSR